MKKSRLTGTASKVNVRISMPVDERISGLSASASMATVTSTTRYSSAVAAVIRERGHFQVIDNDEDVTPKTIETAGNTGDFVKLQANAEAFLRTFQRVSIVPEMTMKRSSLGGALRVSMDGIVNGIAHGLLILYEESAQQARQPEQLECLRAAEQKVTPFIKVCLRQTEDILLFEQRSTTVPFGTADAERVEKENKAYEYVTKGKGRLRRKADSEAQTTSVLYKSRDANTDTIKRFNVASYVSNFDMFDTYQQLQRVTSSIKLDEAKTLDVTTYKVDGVDPCDRIGRLPEFVLAQMITQRILAGNVFKEQQRRFRNMFVPDPLSLDVEYLYHTQILWVLTDANIEMQRRAVSSLSWCPSNGDILAVGYGVFTCGPNFSPKGGYVCIWSIKNPVNPEKIFVYETSVVSVEFSSYRPQLIAVGTYDGDAEIRDIAADTNSKVAISQRATSPGYEPVTDIKWIGLDPGETADVEPFLTVSQDGSIMKYRTINSPYLLGYQHAILDRVEGCPEGLTVQRPWNTLEAVRHPQCLGITLDPTKADIFYVISNEGVIYKCSTNYPQQHLDLWQTHEGAVYSMEFSPWSPKLFLTCGDDWCIRIWIEGIFKPLIKLTSALCPVNCAFWSKTHSTIIVAVNRKTVDVWDIRRSTLKPMSSTKMEKSYLTTMKFSNCGRSLAVGNQRGSVFVCALENMPFPPHFQYEELEAAIFKALMPFPDLATELKGVGYFGYPKKKRTD